MASPRISCRSLGLAAVLALSCNTDLPVSSSCQAPEDCDEGEVCLYGPFECRQRCDPNGDDTCPIGQTCDGCAASSCLGCNDCVAACSF